MANPEHLKILSRGVDEWNRWRAENPGVEPDLREVHLNAEILVGINFSNTFLLEATIINSEAALADFTGAFLKEVNFNETNLEEASLRSAALTWTIFSHAQLAEADFTGAHLGWTTFGDNDLSEVKGLDDAIHIGPSIVGVETIYRSKGNIPEAFLRGCGVPDELIVNARALATARNPIRFYSCFISYSSKDQEFADRLYADLQNKGVRCWFAPEDLKIGDRFRDRIDESIRLHDKLLLILSEHSVSSPWVSDEVEAAIEREHKEGRTVLFPIKIDDAVMESEQAWAATIRRTRHIGDFTRWKDHDSYQKAFDRLLRDLKAET